MTLTDAPAALPLASLPPAPPAAAPAYRSLSEQAKWMIGIVLTVVVLDALAAIIAAHGLAELPPIGQTERSERLLFAAVGVALVRALFVVLGAGVVLSVLVRACRNVHALGAGRVQRPPILLFLLLLVPPVGIPVLVWSYGSRAYKASCTDADSQRRLRRPLLAWLIAYLVALWFTYPVPAERGETIEFYVMGDVPAFIAVVLAGYYLVRFVHHLAELQDALYLSCAVRP